MGDQESIGNQIVKAMIELGLAIITMSMWFVFLALTALRGLVNLLTQMAHFLTSACSLIAKVLIVALVVSATLNAAAATWRAYGRDLPALIPSALLIVVMISIGLTGGNWGALLAVGLVALAIGATIEALDLTTRSLILTGALAAAIAHNQLKESDSHEGEKELQRIYDDHQGRPDLLHDAENGGPGDVHPASEH